MVYVPTSVDERVSSTRFLFSIPAEGEAWLGEGLYLAHGAQILGEAIKGELEPESDCRVSILFLLNIRFLFW